MCVFVVLEKQIDRKSLSPFYLPLQRRCCWRRRMKLQRRSPRWMVRGTRGNKTFQVKTLLSMCCLIYNVPSPQEDNGKPGTEIKIHHCHLITDFLQHHWSGHKSFQNHLSWMWSLQPEDWSVGLIEPDILYWHDYHPDWWMCP